jgi:hypothetical protein
VPKKHGIKSGVLEGIGRTWYDNNSGREPSFRTLLKSKEKVFTSQSVSVEPRQDRRVELLLRSPKNKRDILFLIESLETSQVSAIGMPTSLPVRTITPESGAIFTAEAFESNLL